MIIGYRLRDLREAKNLSQGDIEERSGLLRCYISRVENGHTVPAIETLEKMALALEIPMYRLFYDGVEPPAVPDARANTREVNDWASRGRGQRIFARMRQSMSHMSERDRVLLLHMARRMSQRRRAR